MIDLPAFQWDWTYGLFAAVGIRFEDGFGVFARAATDSHQVLALGGNSDSEYRIGVNVLAVIACAVIIGQREKLFGTGTPSAPSGAGGMVHTQTP